MLHSETMCPQRVVIIGCGWLGTQLGVALQQAGCQVVATRRSHASLTALPVEFEPVCWDGSSLFPDRLAELLVNSWVVIAVPPSAHVDGGAAYLQTLRHVVEHSTSAAGLILCSSTGVYAGLDGLVTEACAPGPDRRAAILWQAEQIAGTHARPLILRLAGLVGPQRHPASFTRRGVMAGPEQPVNLVHSVDVCRWLVQYITQPTAGFPTVVNLVSPLQCTKAEFYLAACRQAGINPPQFVAATETDRRVDGSLSQQLQEFYYQYHDQVTLLQ